VDCTRLRIARFGLALLLSGAAALFWALPAASADIYRWTDESGNLHFTERFDKVPPEHRDAARDRAELDRDRRQDKLNRTSQSAPPASPAPAVRRSRTGDLEIPFTRDGTLMRVEAMVNDTLRVPFLVDTGASGISLPGAYAERLGLAVGPQTERVQVHTANGITTRPIVTLDSVEVGGARVEKLSATVSPSMPVGLLGGSFFNNFVYSVDSAAGVISLAPNDLIRGGYGEDEWRKRFQSIRGPLDRLDAHVRDNPQLREREREVLTRHRAMLVAGLEELEREADKLDVPQIWRD